MEEIEIWQDIPDYIGLYQASTFGRIGSFYGIGSPGFKKRITTERKILKPMISQGYGSVLLVKDKIQKVVKIHRLIATVFHPNPDNLEFVNHLDFDKMNNRPDNLEWVSRRENNAHAMLRKKKSSRYWGVSWHPSNPTNPWRARIHVDKREVHLGCYKTEYEAHLAVVAAMIKYGATNKYYKPKGDSNLESPNG